MSMEKYRQILSTILLSVITVTLFSSVSFLPISVAAADTLPPCVDGPNGREYNSPFLAGVQVGSDGVNAHFYNNSDNHECAPSQAQRDARPWNGIPRPGMSLAVPGGADTSCSGFTGFWGSPFICVTRLVSVMVGSFLISISALFLALADMLFNWSVDNTILLFSSSVFDKVKDGVNAGWTAMRDIANIVIIGMFTFIAISTILGIEAYGAKKMIARVLVIAVLINFSLLFTKIIIDTSNFTASQFYASANGYATIGDAQIDATARSSGTAVNINSGDLQTTSASGLQEQFRNKGIGGAFIGLLGVTSLGSTIKALDKIADSSTGGWYIALAHGLLAFVLLAGAGCVLFYGAYLLISRAVLFIFLMVTAAGAFATHLIPKMDDSEYGWSGWWSSLLHNAALAPILMILLWITLKVSSTVAKQPGGLLGNLVTENASSVDVGALFSYFIILGLLFGSLKLASKWAHKVGGLGLTGSILSSLATAPLALGSRFIAAPLARKYIGGGAAARSMVLDHDIKEGAKRASLLQPGTKAYQAELDKITEQMKEKTKVDKRAKGSFNLPNTKLAQQGMKALGVPSFLTGAQSKPTSFADSAKHRAEEAIKGAEKLVLKKEDISQETRDRIRAGLEQDPRYRESLRSLRNSAQDLRAAADLARDDQGQQLREKERQLADAKADKVRDEGRLAEVNQKREVQQPLLVQLSVQKGNADALVEQEVAKGVQLTTSGAEQSVLAEQQQKIETARANAASIKTRVDAQKSTVAALNQQAQAASTAVTQATNTIQQTQEAVSAINKNVVDSEEKAKNAEAELKNTLDETVEKEVSAIVERSGNLATDAVSRIVHSRATNIVPRMFRLNTELNDNMTKYARHEAEKFVGKLPRIRKYREEREANADLGVDNAPPPPAPHAP